MWVAICEVAGYGLRLHVLTDGIDRIYRAGIACTEALSPY